MAGATAPRNGVIRRRAPRRSGAPVPMRDCAIASTGVSEPN